MVEVFHLRALLKKNQNSTVIYGRFKTVDRLYNYQASGIVLILKLKYVIEDEYTSFSGIRTSIIVAWCFFSSHSIAVSNKKTTSRKSIFLLEDFTEELVRIMHGLHRFYAQHQNKKFHFLKYSNFKQQRNATIVPL